MNEFSNNKNIIIQEVLLMNIEEALELGIKSTCSIL